MKPRTFFTTVLAASILATSPTTVSAQGVEWTSGRADGHAPIGVMGDHVHEKGEYMLSYRYMRMHMEGSLLGSDEIADSEIVSPTGQGFLITPTKMPMQMHMFGGMYAPSDRVTLMAMVPYLSSEMDHITRAGGAFTTSSSGIGDVKLSGLFSLGDQTGSQRMHLSLGVSLPTGSTDEQDFLPPINGDAILPYPMQVGSGSYALMPGITYLTMSDNWSGGLQAVLNAPLNENDRGYKWGERVTATGWLARVLNDNVSISARANYLTWEGIQGADAALNPAAVPTARTDLRGGRRLEVPLGLNLYVPDGSLAGHRLLIEFAFPVYEDLAGPQLQTDWTLMVGWQKSFG